MDLGRASHEAFSHPWFDYPYLTDVIHELCKCLDVLKKHIILSRNCTEINRGEGIESQSTMGDAALGTNDFPNLARFMAPFSLATTSSVCADDMH